MSGDLFLVLVGKKKRQKNCQDCCGERFGKILWEKVRRKQLGYKIRRQHIIGVFIVDFVCITKKLVIELDGKIHQYQQEYDKARTERLNEMDFQVIRFTNEQIMSDLEEVLEEIRESLKN